MNKKLKGFSLAELLISLLVISIVLSAAIPTLTKKSAQDREQIWKWSTDNNSTYFGLGANQSVIIGSAFTPMDTTDDAETPVSIESMMTDDMGNNSYEIAFNNPRFTTDGDKLMILKKSLLNSSSNMANSHIAFYNIDNNASAMSPTYGGRIAVDKHNIAFGRATLLHLSDLVHGNNYSDSYYGENTALGHFALMNLKDGSKNVAVGEKTLTLDKHGYNNTAVGVLAGNQLGHRNRLEDRQIAYQIVDEKSAFYNESGDLIDSEYSANNTALGTYALSFNGYGFGNTVLGASSLGRQQVGDYNTTLGYNSMSELVKGFSNISIGANSCTNVLNGSYNLCLGNYSWTSNNNFDNYGLAIGNSKHLEGGKSYATAKEQMQRSVPLITGHTQRTGRQYGSAMEYEENPDSVPAPEGNNKNAEGYFDKELIVNAKDVEFKPFYGGEIPTFVFTSVPGDYNDPEQTGYGVNDNFLNAGGVSGSAFFNLRYFKPASSSGSSDSVTMQFNAKSNKAIIGTFDPTTRKKSMIELVDLSFNEILKLNVPYVENSNIKAGWQRYSDVSYSTYLRNYKNTNMIGIIADNNSAPVDIFINNRLNVARKAAHMINVDEQGTQIVDMGASMPFEVNIGGYNSPELRVTENGIDLFAQDNRVAIIHSGGITVDKNKDIYISGLAVNDSDGVKASLEYLNKELNQLKSKVGLQTSDARLKNISGDNTAGLNEINKIEVKNYTYKNDKNKEPHVGVIAQQLQKIFPNSVIKGDDGYLRIKTEEIFYAMVNSIKELFAKVQDLTAKVVGLDKRITELEAQNKMLLEQNKAFEKRLEKLEKQAAK